MELSDSDYTIRRAEYEAASPSGSGEMSRETYLRNISIDERNLLVWFFSNLRMVNRYGGIYSALAMGTTTYPDSYWIGLEKYLRENDPSKLDYAKRRGEDLDIMLCGETFPGLTCSWEECLKGDLDKLGLSYEFSDDRREDGTSYLKVPAEHRHKHGDVIRHKVIEYKGSNFRIKINGSRQIHLSVDSTFPTDIKLKEERVRGYSFSVLFRHNAYWDLAEEVAYVNATPSLFNQREKITRADAHELVMKLTRKPVKVEKKPIIKSPLEEPIF